MNRTKTFKIALIAVMSALSVALYLFAKFSLPFLFPTFLDIQISDLPAFITTFMLGLLSGFTVLLIKILIKLPFTRHVFYRRIHRPDYRVFVHTSRGYNLQEKQNIQRRVPNYTGTVVV